MPKEYPRKLRLNVQIQRELTTLIRTELTDPRVAGITVTTVDVAPDMRQANVTVSLLGPDDQLNIAVKALNHAAGKLRHCLGVNLRLRFVPQLHFRPDVALREGDRIAQIIRKAVSEDHGNHPERSESGDKPE